MTVRDRLTDPGRSFTKAEMKVVRELLANYPVGGLTTASGLARRARVSDPTVVRLAAKLGYDGFGDLQKSLIAELDAHLNFPLTILAGRGGRLDGENLPHHFLSEMAGAIRAAGGEIIVAEFGAAVDLLADRRKRVLCLGCRFSRHLAGILRSHFQQLRPQVENLAEAEAELPDRLIDVGRAMSSPSMTSAATKPTSSTSPEKPRLGAAGSCSSPMRGARPSPLLPRSYFRFPWRHPRPSTRWYPHSP